MVRNMDDNQRTQAAALLPARRALAIAGRVLTVLIALIAILATLFTIVSVATFDKVEGKGLFGYKFSIVRSDSMKSEFAAGDVVVTKADSRMEVKPGDIITFRSIDPANYGEVVTHKVQELTSYEGKDAYVTYGTANESADSYPALKEKVIGQYDRENSLFYCDPPYWSTEDYYENVVFGREDHQRLADCLLGIQGRFLLSYNYCDEIVALYKRPGIWLEELMRPHSMAHRFEPGAEFRELLISNYDTTEKYRQQWQDTLFGLAGEMTVLSERKFL